MRLWFIKFGKAITALQKEGFIRGGKRVAQSFFALFRRVGKGDVLIITGGLGDSARYRAWHVAEELTLHGIPACVAVQDNPFLSRYVSRFSVFVFHRTIVTPAMRRMISKIKKQKKTILFDTDDLVFDEKYFEHMDMFTKMNAFEKMQYAGGVGAEILADTYVAVCTASTDFLAKKLRARGKKVFVVKNKLSKEDVLWAQEARVATRDAREAREGAHDSREKRKSKSEHKEFETNKTLLSPTPHTSCVTIGYFSGTKSHDKDFAVVAPALAQILKKYTYVRLFLVGPLERGGVLDPFRDRIETLPYVPRKEHFGNVARVDINIAPLEVGNPFCEAKSELKFFEAGIVEVPTVASATQVFESAMTDGVDGFVAKNEKEWFDRLERLVVNDSLRREMGKRAYETASQKYTTQKESEDAYYDFLRSCIVRGVV